MKGMRIYPFSLLGKNQIKTYITVCKLVFFFGNTLWIRVFTTIDYDAQKVNRRIISVGKVPRKG